MKNLSSDSILNISIDEPEKVFDKNSIKEDLLGYSNLWHPDKSSVKDKELCNKVMAHITLLYKEAVLRVKNNTWQEPNTILLNVGSFLKKFRYLSKITFSLGTIYIGQTRVVTMFNENFLDAAELFQNIQKDLQYPPNKLGENLRKLSPQDITLVSKDSLKGILVTKPTNFLSLYDVQHHFKGTIPIKHVWWIISRCLNLACWLEFSRIMYGGFQIENLYIDPENHEVAPIGGWWYSKTKDSKLILASSDLLAELPSKSIDKIKLANPIYDRYLIRRLGKNLLGDSSGYFLTSSKDIPEPIEMWLNNPPADTAVTDYSNWFKALELAYGKRTFTELKLSEKDLYN